MTNARPGDFVPLPSDLEIHSIPTSSPDPIYSHARYAELVSETVEQIERLSKLKGGEYAGDVDRLANFRRNGKNLGLPMETIWGVYAGKHWDAIVQYIRDIQEGKVRERAEPISGRLDDLVVYCILMKAMIDERNSVAEAPDTA